MARADHQKDAPSPATSIYMFASTAITCGPRVKSDRDLSSVARSKGGPSLWKDVSRSPRSLATTDSVTPAWSIDGVGQVGNGRREGHNTSRSRYPLEHQSLDAGDQGHDG